MKPSQHHHLVRLRRLTPLRSRLLSKNGQFNLHATKIPRKYASYTKDIANTLVSIRWRWLIATIILVNLFFYVLFAGIWMLDAWLSGDLDIATNVNTTILDGSKQNYCIVGTTNFTGYLLLSIESITTTGYGYVYPTEQCHFAWIILTLNTIVMIFIDGAFISLIYVRIARPTCKDSTGMFSRNAVVLICMRNGKLCLILRINDSLSRHVIDPKVKVFLLDEDGLMHEIQTTFTGLLLWPIDVVHVIDSSTDSPLWPVSASDLLKTKFEIFVVLSGESLITGEPSTSRTSYLNTEIRWGYRFRHMTMEFRSNAQQFVVNKHLFYISPYNTPLCSASQLKDMKNRIINYV